MVYNTTYNNTPTRNRKIGLAEAEEPIAVATPAPMVQQMAQQSVAMGNNTPIRNRKVGLPDVEINVPTQEPATTPNVNQPSAGGTPIRDRKVGLTGSPMGTTQQNRVIGRFESPTAAQPIQPSVTGTPSAGVNNNTSSLSAALNGTAPQQPQQAQFEADPNQKDGGFFNWVKGLLPKKRPGKKDGESDEEYDARRTRNMSMLATLADAIRHMGNISYTSKGAPLQIYNDPSTAIQAGYDKRKAERKAKAAAEAEAAKNQMNLTLKQQAAEADRAYKQLVLNYKQKAAERAAKNDEFDHNFKLAGLQRQLDNDAFNHDLSGKKLEESKRHNAVSEGQGAARIALAQEKNGIARARLVHSIASSGGSSGSGKGGSFTNLSSPSGHLNRKKDLNSIEKKQIVQHLIKNGYINKKNLDAYNMYRQMGNTQNMNDLQNYWIATAANMPGKKGDAFRSLLKNHYMYGETNTVVTPKKAQSKKQAAKPKGKSSARSTISIH